MYVLLHFLRCCACFPPFEKVDDETDEDIMAALLDKHLPPGVVMCNGSNVPGGRPALANAQVLLRETACISSFLGGGISCFGGWKCIFVFRPCSVGNRHPTGVKMMTIAATSIGDPATFSPRLAPTILKMLDTCLVRSSCPPPSTLSRVFFLFRLFRNSRRVNKLVGRFFFYSTAQ